MENKSKKKFENEDINVILNDEMDYPYYSSSRKPYKIFFSVLFFFLLSSFCFLYFLDNNPEGVYNLFTYLYLALVILGTGFRTSFLFKIIYYTCFYILAFVVNVYFSSYIPKYEELNTILLYLSVFVIIYLISIYLYHKRNNILLKNHYPYAYEKFLKLFNVKLNYKNNVALRDISLYNIWDEEIFKSLDVEHRRLSSSEKNELYLTSPFSYKEKVGIIRDTVCGFILKNLRNEYVINTFFIIAMLLFIGTLIFAGFLTHDFINLFDSHSFWGQILHFWFVVLIIWMFISFVLLMVPYGLVSSLALFCKYKLLHKHPTFKIIFNFGSDFDYFSIDPFLIKCSSVLIKPVKDEYVYILNNYYYGCVYFIELLSNYRKYIKLLRKNKESSTPGVLLKPEELLLHLSEPDYFEILQLIIFSKEDIIVYSSNYVEAKKDDSFINKCHEVYDTVIKYSPKYLLGFKIHTHFIDYTRQNYDGTKTLEPLPVAEIYFTDFHDENNTKYKECKNSTESYRNLVSGMTTMFLGVNQIKAYRFINNSNDNSFFQQIINTIIDGYSSNEKYCKFKKLGFSSYYLDYYKVQSLLKFHLINGIDDLVLKGLINEECNTTVFNIIDKNDCDSHYYQADYLSSYIQLRTSVIGLTYKRDVDDIEKANFKNRKYWRMKNGILTFSLYNYIPLKFSNSYNFKLTDNEDENRIAIWCFKDRGVSENDKKILSDLYFLLNKSFNTLKNVMVFYVPSKDSSDYDTRYKTLDYFLKYYFGIQSSLHIVSYKLSGMSSRRGEYLEPVIEYDKNRFKNQQVIIFDDVTTSGQTLAKYKRMLESWGAEVICAITLGKTIYQHSCDDIDLLYNYYNEKRDTDSLYYLDISKNYLGSNENDLEKIGQLLNPVSRPYYEREKDCKYDSDDLSCRRKSRYCPQKCV